MPDKINKFLLLVLLVVCGVTYFQRNNYKSVDEIAPETLSEPLQRQLYTPDHIVFVRDGYKFDVTPLYDYKLSGLLVSKMGYRFFSIYKYDSIFPFDVCVIWGSNVKRKVYKKKTIKFSQDCRWCNVSWNEPDVDFDFTEISNNTIISCEDYGIEVISGENSTIIYNTISTCIGHAILLGEEATNFEIFYNSFNNNGVDCQLCDSGTSNIVSQNYYDDWTAPDDNSDGYVDVPYDISGIAENQDLYPLVEAGVIPELPSSTTTTNTTTNSGEQNENLLIQVAIVGGAIAIIVVLVGIYTLKRS